MTKQTFRVTHFPTNNAYSRFACEGSFGETAQEAIVEHLVAEGMEIGRAMDVAQDAEIV